jgi:fluoride exporter
MTGAVTALLICIAGGIGAALRLLLDGLIRARVHSTYPLATTVINLTGSLVLGLLTGLATNQLVPQQWQLIIGTGLLGGYTTFSTASFETVRLIEDRRYVAAALNGLGMLIAGTAAAALGFAAALLLTR